MASFVWDVLNILEESKIMKIEKVSDQVDWVLSNKPHTKSDDLQLTMSVYRWFYEEAFKSMLCRGIQSFEAEIPFELRNARGNMKDLPSGESCSRARRKFNERGMHLPDPATLDGRRKKEFEMKEWSLSDKDHL